MRFSLTALVCLASGLLWGSGSLPAAEPKTAAVSVLDAPATIKWQDISLEDAVTELREKHKFDVALDRVSIENEGQVTTNLKLNLDLRGITLRNILWLALDGHRLELVEKSDGPVITSRPVAEDSYLPREYDLKILGAHAKDPQTVIDLARGCVDAYWVDVDKFGGEIEVEGGKLKVKQIPRVHEKLSQLFNQLYRELGTGKKPLLTPAERNEKYIADTLLKPPLKKLKTTGEIPFRDLMGECGQAFSIFIWVDGFGLEDVRVGYTQPVTPAPQGRTAGEILDSLLAPLELGAVISHEALLITSKTKATLPDQVRVFNTRGKGVKLKGTPEEVARLLQESEEYGLWGDGGGSVQVFGPLVVVRQSPQVLQKIAESFPAK